LPPKWGFLVWRHCRKGTSFEVRDYILIELVTYVGNDEKRKSELNDTKRYEDKNDPQPKQNALLSEFRLAISIDCRRSLIFQLKKSTSAQIEPKVKMILKRLGRCCEAKSHPHCSPSHSRDSVERVNDTALCHESVMAGGGFCTIANKLVMIKLPMLVHGFNNCVL
jgi:hypothetical protein